MRRFQNLPFYDSDAEFGEIKPKKKVVNKPTGSFPARKTFRSNIINTGRESANIIDNRVTLPNARRLKVAGYFTYNTFFHLAARVSVNITAALNSHGFRANGTQVWNRDKNNSQYTFVVDLLVYNNYSDSQVIESLVTTLTRTIALAGSVRIYGVKNLYT